MKTNLLKISGLLIGLVFVFALLPQSDADLVWEDDFNDTIIDDWTVTQGGWTAANQTLESVYSGTDPLRWYSIIWHESNRTMGTWSFDYQLFDGGSWVYTTILFMANGTDPPFDYYGYGIRIRDTSAIFVKQHGDQNRVDTYGEGVAYFDDVSGTWTHFDITRDATGTFNVYINATTPTDEPAFTVVDDEYDYSERFVIYHRGGSDACIDNLVVNDTINFTYTTATTTTTSDLTTTTTDGGTTPPPQPLDSTLLIAGGGVVGVVVIVAVVFLRKR